MKKPLFFFFCIWMSATKEIAFIKDMVGNISENHRCVKFRRHHRDIFKCVINLQNGS